MDSRLRLTDDGNLVIDGFEDDDVGDYDCELELDTDTSISVRHGVHLAISPMVTTVPASGHVTAVQVLVPTVFQNLNFSYFIHFIFIFTRMMANTHIFIKEDDHYFSSN